jgi:putative pyruvate formate lyase activating enzyme
VNRLEGKRGFCGETAELRIAVASIHRGEEPPITGLGGSGTIFITGCTLRCSFCQNYQISQESMGRTVGIQEFIAICLALQSAGAENINLVTGSHALPALALGIQGAREQGLYIPTLWNSSAYESVQAVELGAPYLDVYLPDLKTLDSGLSARLFDAPDYPETATRGILKMMDLKPLTYGFSRHAAGSSVQGLRAGEPTTEGFHDEAPQILLSGVVVRHLVLPDHLESTHRVLRWFAENASGRALLSVMTQYTPIKKNTPAPLPERFIEPREFDQVQKWLEELDIEDGFYQELAAGDEWLPDFDRKNPFSSDLSKTIWHWKTG